VNFVPLFPGSSEHNYSGHVYPVFDELWLGENKRKYDDDDDDDDGLMHLSDLLNCWDHWYPHC